MGPELTMLATLASTATTAVTAIVGGQAAQEKAAAESQWAKRRADDELASGQRAAGEERRKAEILQSRLGAVAGASGSGASDKTVRDIWGDIQQEGDTNAGVAQAMGQQRADSINYQSALDRWSADNNAKLSKLSAAGTIIGGLGKAYGQYDEAMAKPRMAARYGGWQTTTYRSRYG